MTTFPTTKEALQAIEARIQGVYDNPSLLRFGPLHPNCDLDVMRIKVACLEAYGYTVGKRDSRLNTKYGGNFMVVESHEDSELPTEDGSNGPWCVVGDDLPDLVNTAFEVLIGMAD